VSAGAGRRGGLAERGPGELTVRIEAGVPAEVAFAAVTDWLRQRDWVPFTRVRVTRGDGRSAGSELAAYTGVGRLGFTDYMEIVRYEPPHLVEVVHYGKLVRGPAAIRVEKLSDDRALIVWEEWLHLPLGRLGRLGWPVVRMGAAAGFQRSLRLLKRSMEGSREWNAGR
jgi:Polyketide cyclase / dehydrase and lipid transport